MKKATFELKQSIEICKNNGFVAVRNNLYRCYGDGLLQVISYHKNRSVLTPRESDYEVVLGVFSLYSELNWITSRLLAKVVQFDLPVTYEAAPLLAAAGNLPQSQDIAHMTDAVIPYLNSLITPTQLVCMLEQDDMLHGGQIIKNDEAKIVPYILSGQCNKAVECISAIEHQNWDAYSSNCRSTPNYDKEGQKRIIEERLASLIALRNALHSNDHAAVSAYLSANFQNNSKRLKSLGVRGHGTMG